MSRLRLLALMLAFLPAVAAQVAESADQLRNLELFLLIGQSNMAGRGQVEAQDREPIRGVYVLNREMKWAPAVDPLHFDKPDIAGTGLARTFARYLLRQNPKASIGLIPAAFGGTSLDQWAPGGELYQNAVRRAREAAKSGRLRGILWHQGEADSGKEENAKSYRRRFAAMIRQLRQDLGAGDIPVVVGQIGEFYRAPFARTVQEEQALIPLMVPRSAFVSSAGLGHKGDGVHFDSAALRELGRRYAHAYLSLELDWEEK